MRDRYEGSNAKKVKLNASLTVLENRFFFSHAFSITVGAKPYRNIL